MTPYRRLACLALILGSVACRRGSAPGRATLGGDPEAPLPSPLPEVAATVNGHAITSLRVAHIARLTIKETTPAAQSRAMRTTLAECIDRELLLQEALARGVTVPQVVIDSAFDQVRGRHKSETAWIEALEKDGLAARSFRTELQERYTVEALIASVKAGVPMPTETELRQYQAAHPDPEAKEAPGDPEAARNDVTARWLAERRDGAVAQLLASLRGRARVEVYY
jgi:hypothetical protein